jgi:hypothetical protein
VCVSRVSSSNSATPVPCCEQSARRGCMRRARVCAQERARGADSSCSPPPSPWWWCRQGRRCPSSHTPLCHSCMRLTPACRPSPQWPPAACRAPAHTRGPLW